VSASTGRGVVAAGDPQTANAGAALLRQGGNAVDAAVAAAFASFVCELPLCSPLGGGVMLVDRASGEAHAIDAFARTPGLGAQRMGRLDFDDVEVTFGAANQIFHVGRGSAAVPLALPGLLEAHRRWGKRPLEAVVEPAVALGRSGYELGSGVAFVFRILTPIVERTPECRALFADGAAIAQQGARLRNPDLANTVERLARRPELLHDLFAALVREFGPEQGGMLTARDIAAARIAELEPVRVQHRGWTLSTMPGPSTGGVLVALGLRLLEGVGSEAFLSAGHLERVAAVQAALLAERDEHFDQRCRDAEAVRAMLDEHHVAQLRGRLGMTQPPRPDNPLGSTTHISVIDADGDTVSLTLTNGEGCGHVLAGTGMIVNNLMGEEDIHPRGFHRDAPGTSLSTMMAPTLLRRGTSHVALGSGGSNRLRNAILQVLVGLLEHEVDPERAVRAPRLQLDPAGEGHSLALERTGLDPAIVAALTERYPDSPRVFDELNLYFGGVHVATSDASGFGGAGDPRRGGAVAIA
jgi:gamma-glutamyltranspeptidase/glutathione hydrolase